MSESGLVRKPTFREADLSLRDQLPSSHNCDWWHQFKPGNVTKMCDGSHRLLFGLGELRIWAGSEKEGVMKEHLGCGLCGSVNRQVHWRHEPPFSGIGKHRHLPVVLSPEVYVCLD